MRPKATSTSSVGSREHHGPSGALAGSHGDAISTIVRTTVQSDGKHDAPSTQTAPPSHANITQTSEQSSEDSPGPAFRVPQPYPRTQLRDPERYQILGEHGRGGLGKVSRAHDRDLGRDVAIKELISRGHISEVRFLREALITARLEHPGIVPVHEAGRWPDGTPFYAMKLVAGRPLRDLIAERTTVEQRIGLLHHVIAVADAIAYAHGRNIIHRDLKPANVIVGDFGETVVIDWGLAKDLSTTEESMVSAGPFRAHLDTELTSTGAVLGTPTYMAPEQERGEPVDQRADVFAIGAMLWELCSLQKVPPSNVRHRHRMLRSAGIDHDLAVIIDKALDPDPARRYPDAGALAADLKAFKSGARIGARRYSVPALLGHWTRRHRALALVITTALILLSVTVAVSLINIARDRARAIASREAAVIATATALLDRDPTRAWSTLQGIPPSSCPLLRARIRSGGVADLTTELPGRLDQIFTTPSGRWIIASTSDRAVYAISPENGTMRRIADGLTEPSTITVTDDLVYFVRRQDRLTLESVAIEGGQSRTITELVKIPVSLVATNSKVLWSDAEGTIFGINNNEIQPIAHDIAQFSIVDTAVMLCSRDGNLRVIHDDGALQLLGPCLVRWPWTAGHVGFVIPRNDKTLTFLRNGEVLSITFDTSPYTPNPKLSSTGLLVAVDATGAGAFLKPKLSDFERVRINGRVTAIAARDDYAAWGFSDGSAKVIDTRSGQEWSIQAHPQDVWWLSVLPRGRLVTSGRRTLRFWTLPSTAPIAVAEVTSSAFNVAFNESGDALLDGNNGQSSLIMSGQREARAIHKHEAAAYGIAWCGRFACSTSWDTHVICTDTQHLGSPSISTDLGSPTVWIASGGGRCYVAAAAGGIYDALGGAVRLYSHSREPYRLATSRDGRFVVSGDWAGNIIVYDTTAQRILAKRAGVHHGLITNIALTSSNIITSGADGLVRVLTISLEDVHVWFLNSAVRYIAASDNRIGAALEDGRFWVQSLDDNMNHVVKIDTTFTSFAISPNGRDFVAGDADGELLVVNGRNEVAAIRLERGRVTCAAFDTESAIMACSPTGRIYRIPISSLYFQKTE